MKIKNYCNIFFYYFTENPRYVIRVNHNGNWIPGELNPMDATAYICDGGIVHPYKSYEVLVDCSSKWAKATEGRIDESCNAIISKRQQNSDNLDKYQSF